MKRSEFVIGREFWCGGKRWRCTDIGTRVVVAICLEPHEVVNVLSSEPKREVRSMTDDATWFNGPPYAVPETVFDEYDMPGCSLEREAQVL